MGQSGGRKVEDEGRGDAWSKNLMGSGDDCEMSLCVKGSHWRALT